MLNSLEGKQRQIRPERLWSIVWRGVVSAQCFPWPGYAKCCKPQGPLVWFQKKAKTLPCILGGPIPFARLFKGIGIMD